MPDKSEVIRDLMRRYRESEHSSPRELLTKAYEAGRRAATPTNDELPKDRLSYQELEQRIDYLENEETRLPETSLEVKQAMELAMELARAATKADTPAQDIERKAHDEWLRDAGLKGHSPAPAPQPLKPPPYNSGTYSTPAPQKEK